MKPGGNFDTEMIGQFFKTPASTYVLSDSYGAYNYSPNSNGGFALNMDYDGDGIMDSPLWAVGQPVWTFDFFRPRHHGGNSMVGSVDKRMANFAFADRHVELRTFRQWLDDYQHMWGDPPN
jgi:hypothetical protein